MNVTYQKGTSQSLLLIAPGGPFHQGNPRAPFISLAILSSQHQLYPFILYSS